MCRDHSCKGQVLVDEHGSQLTSSAPQGFGADDLQAIYNIDPTLGDGITIAVVDAYGYQDLESDLAVYREQYNLGDCTIASGCLTIVNNNGDTSPLAGDTDQGWIGETALDVQMISAGCPRCKIIVIQADSAGAGLEVGQTVARRLQVDAISDSWGGMEGADSPMSEGDYDNPGIGTFVSTGDNGYAGGVEYPASSAFAIAVGGVSFAGGVSSAWSGAGSGCSAVIPKQTWSPTDAPCSMRAVADISAIADPMTGVAVYNAKQGQWSVVGGTSAAAPLSAALFAGAGHGDARAAFVYKHRDAFTDVTTGSSGSCGGTLCNSVLGWDGPTGVGTPDQAMLKAIGNVAGAGPAVTITFPSDGATVPPGFSIQAAPDPDTTAWIEIQIDGQRMTRLNADPWTTTTLSSLALGSHTITAIAYDIDHNSQTATATITVGTADSSGSGGGGGCSTGSADGGIAVVLVVCAGLVSTRRRRSS